MKKKILIVDDSDFDRTLVVLALAKREEYEFYEAPTSEACFEILRSNPIDIVLLDIMMPGSVSGLEILKTLRSKSNAVELPVIMISSVNEASEIVEAFRLEANDYITKPINLDIAHSRISTHLKVAELSRQMAGLREIAALHAMTTTYHHEINNPLAIAIGSLEKLAKNRTDDACFKNLGDALWRVSDVVGKIKAVTKKEIQFDSYPDQKKMVKI